MLKLGLGSGFMIWAPIFLAIIIANDCLSLISIVMTCGLFGSLLYFMLPKRRPVEAVLVEGEGSENNIGKDSSSVLKKHRIDCYLESTAANSNKNTSSVIGNCSGISSESGGVEEKVSMALGDSNPVEIDEDLHSRQLAVYGRETMRRLFASNVLVSGMQGLGVEIAKNLVLAGVKMVTLHDEGVVELWDLSSNFVFSENDVGANRALASVQKLQELNNAVVISTLTTELTKEHLSKFQVLPSRWISRD
ncbi:UBIQUITIN-ACTIVATING ENZYME E1 1 [Salix viminalis]|uniref:UBIQUITIN-ACTIVATING ENZYME E1 1 n=1 Tax=Salix viminalis TaxID=40686 RepID=A0A9Q0NJK4_SALVM|nr:UBIQUITIN-ACTIVATING ENZYME E1 1 [Salix viminalis]